MTWANRITIFRLLLIPFFVGALLYYGQTVKAGAANESYRIAAIIIFIVAAISDGVDGYLARNFNQKTKLGTILDPIADKLLMFAALLTLSFISGVGIPDFPLWFPLLIITRDALLLLGALVLHFLTQQVHVRPHWTGKTSTCLVFIAISAALLKLDWTIYVCYAGGFFTLICTVLYVRDGIYQLHHSDSARAVLSQDKAVPKEK
jgi:cardiolipin synthase (CMP-forming)